MSVVALVKFKDGTYHMFSDGRMTAGDRIITDSTPKVFKTESVYRTPLIYGFVGDISDMLPLHNTIQAHGHDKNALYTNLNEDLNKIKFTNFGAIVVNDHDVLMIDSISRRLELGDTEVKTIAVTQFNDHQLPMFIGSGQEALQAVFAARSPKNSEQVRKCYQIAYGLVSSIGGEIFEEVL